MTQNNKRAKIFFVLSLILTLMLVYCPFSVAADRITNGTSHRDGRINDNGEVVCVWEYYAGQDTSYDKIYSTTRGFITSANADHYSPDVNDNGDVVYTKKVDGVKQVFLYKNSGSVKQITDDPNDHFTPSINNNREIVWAQKIDGVMRIVFYSDSSQTVLTGGSGDCSDPMINDRGEVVYVKEVGSYTQIFSTDRGQITSGNKDHWGPDINDSGEIIWLQADGNGDFQVYSNVRGKVTSDTSYPDKYTPSINDKNELVWTHEYQHQYYGDTDQIFKLSLGAIDWDYERVEDDDDDYWYEVDDIQITQTAEYEYSTVTNFSIVGGRAFWEYAEYEEPHYYCYYNLIYQEGPTRVTQKASWGKSITNFSVSGDRVSWTYDGKDYHRDLPDGEIIEEGSSSDSNSDSSTWPWNPYVPGGWNPIGWNTWNPIGWNMWNPMSSWNTWNPMSSWNTWNPMSSWNMWNPMSSWNTWNPYSWNRWNPFGWNNWNFGGFNTGWNFLY